MDGEVTTRVETPIPNTDMYLLSFNVTYRRSTPEDGVDLPQQDDVVVEKGVKSDRIRLLGTPDGELLLPAMHPNLPPPKPKIDENTGSFLRALAYVMHILKYLCSSSSTNYLISF